MAVPRNFKVTSAAIQGRYHQRWCLSSSWKPASHHPFVRWRGQGLESDTNHISLQPSAAASSSASAAMSGARIYSKPKLYDDIFGFRDYAQEVSFLSNLLSLHGPENPIGAAGEVRRALDLGCGTGRHAVLLSRAGFAVTGLDSSAPMLEYAARVAAEEFEPTTSSPSAGVEWVQGDMTAFVLPRRRFDLVTIMLGTLSHLHANEDVIACLQCVRAHLNDGGLAVIELSHPEHLFNLYGELGTEAWDVTIDCDESGGDAEAAQDGSRPAVVRYGLDDDIFNPRTQVLERTLLLCEREDERDVAESEADATIYEEVVHQRLFTTQEMVGYAREPR